jgi:hypothetical protein
MVRSDLPSAQIYDSEAGRDLNVPFCDSISFSMSNDYASQSQMNLDSGCINARDVK